MPKDDPACSLWRQMDVYETICGLPAMSGEGEESQNSSIFHLPFNISSAVPDDAGTARASVTRENMINSTATTETELIFLLISRCFRGSRWLGPSLDRKTLLLSAANLSDDFTSVIGTSPFWISRIEVNPTAQTRRIVTKQPRKPVFSG